MGHPTDTVSSNKTFVSETIPEIDIDVQNFQYAPKHKATIS